MAVNWGSDGRSKGCEGMRHRNETVKVSDYIVVEKLLSN